MKLILVTLFQCNKLRFEFLVLDSSQVFAELIALNRFFDAVNVITLKKLGLISVNITRVKTIDSTLKRRFFTPELLVYAYQLLQILSLNVNVNVNKACLELPHLECFNQILEVRSEHELNLVLLKILFE